MTLRWLTEHALRLGPFAAAAKEFASWRGLEDVAAGEAGVRTLAREVDAFAHDTLAPEDADDRFLDGAGALLGAILVAHLPGARHAVRDGRHALSFDSYGFFDPFEAMDATLDAERPLEALAEALGRAEAEARGESECARAVTLLADLLGLKRPELTVLSAFASEVTLGDGIEINVREAMRASGGEHGDLSQAISRLIDLLPGGDERAQAEEWSYARPRLLPRLVGARFLLELDAQPGGSLYREPLVGDVYLALVLAHEDRARFVREDEVDCWGVTETELQAAYLARLAERSKTARFDAVESEHGVMVVARSGDALDSARLVLPGLYGVLCAELMPPLRVSVPHRDTLLAVSATDEAQCDALALRTQNEFARAPHGISAQVFELGRRGPRLVSP